MDNSGHQGAATREAIRGRFALAATGAALALMLMLMGAPAAQAADDKPSAADENCLACHGAEGMEKTLADGDKLSLRVNGDTFAKSVHAPLGCTGCHTDIDLKSHPPAANDIKSARDFSLTMVNICKTCHSDKFEEWDSSVHAALVRDGNVRAPLCTGCHNPHGVIKGAAATIEQIPCQRCHQDIYKAYLGSVHAQARQNPATSYAPLCSGCHGAHAIKPVVTLGGPKAACLGCHAEVLEKHQAWLPNAALHFDIVSCPACHAPGAERQVDLMIYDRHSQAQVTQEGVPQFEPRSDATDTDESLDAVALWRLLTGLNRDDKTNNIVLHGRLEVRTGPEAHRLADKSKAVSNCNTCHHRGSDAFQNVTVSIVGADGRRIRQEASPGVLTSAISTRSLAGFYAIGATRVGLLDALLILGFLGGFTFWLGHLTIRWLYKRFGLNRS